MTDERPAADDFPLTWWMSDPQTWEAWLAGFRAGRVRTPGPGAPLRRPTLGFGHSPLAETPGLTPIQIRDKARRSWGWPCLPPWRDGRLDWDAHVCTRVCAERRRAG